MTSQNTKFFKKGETILVEGTPGEEAYVINKGHVEIKKQTLDDTEVVIATLGPGQIFGEMCLFDDSPRSASVYAINDLEVIVISKEEFLSYLKDTPTQIKIILELLLKRLRQTSYLITLLKLDTKRSKEIPSIVDKNLTEIDFPT
ncbi:MAG: cyclic nucleotide-binding domain-containing protein [Cyanobacteriota bacterium]